MITPHRLLARDAATANRALENLHRCISKLKDRAEKHQAWAFFSLFCEAQEHLGHVLGALDQVKVPR